MSTERIQYNDAPLPNRIIAIIIDSIIVLIIALICYFGALIENELIWKTLLNDALHLDNSIWVAIWFVVGYPIYYILFSALTEGQTLGKMLSGIRVMTSDNKSTKKAFKLHFKRFFLMRKGTRVVKEVDPGVKGL
ncbi:MAG: RDD family protein [Candidatus Hodarchaeales archaeon]